MPVLKALLSISEAVSRADYFDQVLEVIAEQARTALAAASLSISRWEPEHVALRILVNVGDLAPHERRWGDEFCVLLPDATLASAQVFADDATLGQCRRDTLASPRVRRR